MHTENYKVKILGFEGPFDVLLDLIEKRKLFINDISLAKVTDDFITHVKNITEFPLGMSANFILVASTLLLIKSKSLLPALKLSDEEETSIEELERRLKLYKRMKELSRGIAERFGKEVLFASEGRPEVKPIFSPDLSVSLPNILSSARAVLASLPKLEKIPKAVLKKVVSLEDMIKALTERITHSLSMSFREFANHKSVNGLSRDERVSVIVSFLAMLELVKQGVINVTQEAHFRDIEMQTAGELGTPKY